nr:hypothetical protein [Morganella morganii]
MQNKLADYYIALAEISPIIPIGSANRVEVVFRRVWAEFLEDKESQDQPGEMTADGHCKLMNLRIFGLTAGNWLISWVILITARMNLLP